MSSKQALNDILEYNNLPETPEKGEINARYLNGEIDSLEFYSNVREYLTKHKELQSSDNI